MPSRDHPSEGAEVDDASLERKSKERAAAGPLDGDLPAAKVSLHDRLKVAALSASRRRLSFHGATTSAGQPNAVRATIFSLGNKLSPTLADGGADSTASPDAVEQLMGMQGHTRGGSTHGPSASIPSVHEAFPSDFARSSDSGHDPDGKRQKSRSKKDRRRRHRETHAVASLAGRHNSDEGIKEERSERSLVCRTLPGRGSIITHRDSIEKGHKDRERCGLGKSSPQEQTNASGESPGPRDSADQRALRRVRALAGCSGEFLQMLIDDGECIQLKAGESRGVGMRAVGLELGAAQAVIVQSGVCRVEVNRVLMDEFKAGSAYGLGSALSRVFTSCSSSLRDQSPTELTIRASSASEGCRCIAISSLALQKALVECPSDREHLRGLITVVHRPVDGTRSILSALHLSEAFKPVAARSSTRHIFMPGEYAFREGRRNPDGIVFVRSGRLALEVQGVVVRHVGEGQVVGQELFLDVCQRWATTARCVAVSEVQVFSRSLFLARLREMRSGNGEEERQQQRLLALLEGRWKDDRVIPAWSFFRGYDPEFLSALARLMETRVVFPGARVCESGGAHEVALYFLLHGTSEETTTTQDGRVKRVLKPGACVGIRDFLGVQELSKVELVAQSLCLVAALHRAVFLHAVDSYPKQLQSPEVVKLLSQELDRTSPVSDPACEPLIVALPFFHGCDRRFVDVICNKVERRWCMSGQRICRSGEASSTMFVVSRGTLAMTIAGLQIRQFGRGYSVNTLAMSNDCFIPNYTLASEAASEVWALTRSELSAALENRPAEKRRLAMVTNVPLKPAKNPVTPSRMARTTRLSAGADDPPAGWELSKVEVLHGCSGEFLQWIEQHLEMTVFFPDEIVQQEGQRDPRMYIIRQGTVIMEGTGTRQSQISMGRGTVFSEQHVLEVVDFVQSTATAVEVTIVQVLHLPVLRRGLELFPQDAVQLNQMAVAWLNRRDKQPLLQVPLFGDCSKALMTKLSGLLSTRIVQKGVAIVKEGDLSCDLLVLRSGSATTTSSKAQAAVLVEEYSAIGAEVVFGVSRAATATVRAEQVCAVSRVDSSIFRSVLQRFPKDVDRLVKTVVAGPVFPTEVDQVPFFRGVGAEPFRQLMEPTEWVMILPDQFLVKQGGTGSVMHLLCYGSATMEVDGVVVRGGLEPGECIGVANLFGVCRTYKSSIRSRTLCHFRVVSQWMYDRVVVDHPAEREKFDQMKQQLQRGQQEEDRQLAAEVSRRKLKKRVAEAFEKHVASQVARVAENVLPTHEIPERQAPRTQPARAQPDESSRRESWTFNDTSGQSRAQARGKHRKKTRGSTGVDSGGLEASQSDCSDSDLTSGSSSDESGALRTAKSGSHPFTVTITAASNAAPSSRGGYEGGSLFGPSNAASDFSEDDDATPEPGKISKVEQITGAIGVFAGSRRKAMLRGKVLRLLHSDLRLDAAPRRDLLVTASDMQKLDDVLPKLPVAAPPSPPSPDRSPKRRQPSSARGMAAPRQLARLELSPLTEQQHVVRSKTARS